MVAAWIAMVATTVAMVAAWVAMVATWVAMVAAWVALRSREAMPGSIECIRLAASFGNQNY
jgi:hypothetical protein